MNQHRKSLLEHSLPSSAWEWWSAELQSVVHNVALRITAPLGVA